MSLLIIDLFTFLYSIGLILVGHKCLETYQFSLDSVIY